MSGFKKILMGLVTSLALMNPFAATPTALANGPGQMQTCHYHIYARACARHPWIYVGTYRGEDVQEARAWLWLLGYESFVR